MVTIVCDGCGQSVQRLQHRRSNKSGRVFCTIRCRNVHYGPRATVPHRFWSKVRRGEPDECWLWTGSLMSGGYGCLRIGGVTRTSHTVTWELAHGPIPSGMCVCHHCDVRACCNPAHLFIGSYQDNVNDAKRKGHLHGAIRPLKGDAHPSSKLSSTQVADMRRRYPQETASALARCFRITPQQAWKIVHHQAWKTVS
jgi:HNH endonuclease